MHLEILGHNNLNIFFFTTWTHSLTSNLPHNMATTHLQFIVTVMLCHMLYAAYFVPTEQVSTEQLPTQQSPCTFTRGSIPCKVWNYTNLDCSNRALDCIPPLPQDIPLKLIDLSSNSIPCISNDAFSNQYELQSLVLIHNKIHRIPGDAFRNLGKLQSLDLSRNDISVLKQKAFSGLQELQQLNLRGNSLSHIECDVFRELPNLLSLDLSYNSLSYLCDNVFSKLCALQNLDLSSNHLLINNNSLDGLGKLKHLDLSYNALRILNGSSFHGLISLQTLTIRAYEVTRENPYKCNICWTKKFARTLYREYLCGHYHCTIC